MVRNDDTDDPLLAMTVEDVCRLAWDYKTMRTHGARELIARSGYADRWRSITVGLLAATLRTHADWADAWIQWSEDKRGGSGWYIYPCGESGYDVGSYSTSAPTRFADRIEACAAFVHHELASIADLGPRPE